MVCAREHGIGPSIKSAENPPVLSALLRCGDAPAFSGATGRKVITFRHAAAGHIDPLSNDTRNQEKDNEDSRPHTGSQPALGNNAEECEP